MNTIRKVVYLLIGLALGLHAQVQTEIVVKLSENEMALQAGEQLFLRGNTPSLGAWQGSGQALRQKENSFNLQLEIPAEETAHPIFYKIVKIDLDGRASWEVGPNRELDASAARQAVAKVRFRPYSVPVLAQATRVFFEVDVDGLYGSDHGFQHMAVFGSVEPLNWAADNPALFLYWDSQKAHFRGGLQLPAGAPALFEFKLAFPGGDGDWNWEYLPGDINHLVLLEQNPGSPTVRLVWQAEFGYLRALKSPGLAVDTYQQIIKQQQAGEYDPRWHYFAALDLLARNKFPQAEKQYERFRKLYPGAAAVDNFYVEYGQRLQAAGRSTEAVAAALAVEKNAKDRHVKASHRFLAGQLAAENGDYEAARAHYRKVWKQYPDELDASLQARYEFALTFAAEDDANWKKSTQKLEELLQNEGLSEAWQRRLHSQLARFYKQHRKMKKTLGHYQALTRIGKPGQRQQAELQLLRYQIRKGQNQAALERIAILQTASEWQQGPRRWQLSLARAKALYKNGDYSAAETELEAMIAACDSDKYLGKAARLKQKWVDQRAQAAPEEQKI
jgi:TolA-binding protein